MMVSRSHSFEFTPVVNILKLPIMITRKLFNGKLCLSYFPSFWLSLRAGCSLVLGTNSSSSFSIHSCQGCMAVRGSPTPICSHSVSLFSPQTTPQINLLPLAIGSPEDQSDTAADIWRMSNTDPHILGVIAKGPQIGRYWQGRREK